ncbi:MAG: response regulator transcription factor [Thermogutta sp.]|nr:response regulator transcription factor [Thermogutta sp.]HPU05812.1 response regulator transcription factor [Thermogutta sp.]HQF12463.1 response regulator transcription factor [Thermogutta sp.]
MTESSHTFSSEKKIRVFIADDHDMVRIGLKAMLSVPDIEVVGEAGTGEDAVNFLLNNDVDVAILDVRMPRGDGLNALGRIKLEKPELPVLMLSTYDNPTYIARAVAFQAQGYLLKSCSREELLDAIRKAARGENIWTRDELRRVAGGLATPRMAADVDIPLTQRESEVLKQLANGLTNKEIAQILNISYETVKEHVQHILRKIGVTHRTQAAVWAVKNRLV